MEVALLFSSGETAAFPVAAVPAVARAAREVALAGARSCIVVTPEEWQPDPAVLAEMRRLAPALSFSFAGAAPPGCALVLLGEQICPASEIEAALGRSGTETADPLPGHLPEPAARAMLRDQHRRVISNAGKPGDGIVSRYLNRPVSKAISRCLLALGPVPPTYATVGTGLIGLAMLLVLVLVPGYQGQLWGALLFHAASVFDGVDGELARATFRSSRFGASLDSLVDLGTNIAFFAGLVWNFHASGNSQIATIAFMGLGALAVGKLLLGLAATNKGEAITFNAVKAEFARRPSRIKQVLTWLTMRDFYAFAAVVLVASGYGAVGVYAFAVVVAGWLAVVVFSLQRTRRTGHAAAAAKDAKTSLSNA